MIANSLSYDKNDLRRPVLAGYNNGYSILAGYNNGDPDLLEVGPTQIVENNRILQKVTSLGKEYKILCKINPPKQVYPEGVTDYPA